MRTRVLSLALLSGLRIQRCSELWCRWQTWLLGSGVVVAVVQAGSYSSHSTPSLGTSICHRCGRLKKKKEEEKEEKRKEATICHCGSGLALQRSGVEQWAHPFL